MMDEEEVFSEDSFEEVKPNASPPKIEIPDEVEIPIPNSELHRTLQRGDLINNNETYDTEISVPEGNIPITNEKFRGEILEETPPIIESPQKIIKDSIDTKAEPPRTETKKQPTHFEQDKANPIPIKSGGSSQVNPKEESLSKVNEESNSEEQDTADVPPKRKVSIPKKPPIKEKEIVSSDLDEDSDSKEYISRRSIIIGEAKKDSGIQKYKPTKVYVEEPDTKDSNLGRVFIIVLILAILVGGIFWGIRSGFFKNQINSFGLSDLDRAILTREYDFISSSREYLETINSAVEEERQILESYVNSGTSNDETIKRLNGILDKKTEAYNDYSKMKPNYEEVAETKRLADKIFENTISYTEEAIESVSKNGSKAKLIANFNVHVDDNNSSIYMYNQYVISVFQKRNIQITYNNTSFSMDTSWLKS